MRQIDKDWDTLFKQHGILETINKDGFFKISSKQINEVHEARLMTKFDNRENLPDAFRKNHLSILPITRGNYIIGAYDAYENVTYADIENMQLSLPEHIESINLNDLYSESACLNCAYTAGIIDDLCGSHALPTVSGRMSSNSFDFQIKNSNGEVYHDISVANSQVEIDGGYETEQNLILIEAKNYSADDFLIRQLYYPYRLWHDKISKPIIPVFLTFSNDVFSFFIYEFQDPNVYNSIKLVQQRNYIISPEPITLNDIYDVLTATKIEPEPEIPFPQCNNFERIVDLLGLLMQNKEMTTSDITTNYAFVYRQTSYYTNGAIYLGLIEKFDNDNGEICYRLTSLGQSIMSKHHKQKNLDIVKQILKHEAFYKALQSYFKKSSPLSNQEISEIMKCCNLYHVTSQNTVERRAQTVSRWIEWILDLQE